MARINKSKRCQGAEMMEFTLVLLPLLMMIFLLLDACWGMFVKGTLAFAAHEGVRVGITITGNAGHRGGLRPYHHGEGHRPAAVARVARREPPAWPKSR